MYLALLASEENRVGCPFFSFHSSSGTRAEGSRVAKRKNCLEGIAFNLCARVHHGERDAVVGSLASLGLKYLMQASGSKLTSSCRRS